MFSEQEIISAVAYYRRGLLTYEELLMLISNELHNLKKEVEDCLLLKQPYEYVEN